MLSLDLFLSPKTECNYLPGQPSRSLFVDPEAALNPRIYSQLLAAGYRRSGDYVYTPRCPNCIACKSVRLPVELFKPNRSQQRCSRLNHDLSIDLVGEITEEHLQLYQKYMKFRHHDSLMADYQLDDCRQFMLAKWCDTQLLEFRLKQKLLAVAVTDQVPDALSAVYTYFDPDHHKRSLGVYAILTQIDLVRQLQLDWLYLGFWIADCSKMRYKTNYQPFELRIANGWQLFDSKTAIQMLST